MRKGSCVQMCDCECEISICLYPYDVYIYCFVKVVINYFLWFHFKILHRSSFHSVDTDGKVINIYRTIGTHRFIITGKSCIHFPKIWKFSTVVPCQEECEVHLQPKKNHTYGK